MEHEKLASHRDDVDADVRHAHDHQPARYLQPGLPPLARLLALTGTVAAGGFVAFALVGLGRPRVSAPGLTGQAAALDPESLGFESPLLLLWVGLE